HARMRTERGLRALANQPASWKAELVGARAELDKAKTFASNADAMLGDELAQRMQQLASELDHGNADYELTLLLEKIREDASAVVEGKFNFSQSEEKYLA